MNAGAVSCGALHRERQTMRQRLAALHSGSNLLSLYTDVSVNRPQTALMLGGCFGIGAVVGLQHLQGDFDRHAEVRATEALTAVNRRQDR